MNQSSGLNLRSSAWGENGEALKNNDQNRFQLTNLGFSEKRTSVWRTLSRNVWQLTRFSVGQQGAELRKVIEILLKIFP